MRLKQSDLAALYQMGGDPRSKNVPLELSISKREAKTLKTAEAICSKAAHLLGSDDEYDLDADCPYFMAASWLSEITNQT